MVLPHHVRNQTRCIRDIDLVYNDIAILEEGEKKIPSCIMNSFAARLQDMAEDKGAPDWVILSSWLGPLVTGAVHPTKRGGGAPWNAEGHISILIESVRLSHLILVRVKTQPSVGSERQF